MKEKQDKRINVRITKKDLYILSYLKKKLGLSTYKLIKIAVENYYFSFIKQAEYDYESGKKL